MSEPYPYPSNDEIRQWAMTKTAGAGLAYTGRLPKAVIAGWNRAHPDRPYVKAEAYHGSPGGYTAHNCRCERCTAAATAAVRDSRAARDGETS